MVSERNWDQTDLADYLRYDNWKPEVACRILASTLDSCFSSNKSDPIYGHRKTTKPRAVENTEQKLRNLWMSRGNGAEHETHPPAYFIEWAISKNFRPEWLEWAIKEDILKHDTEKSDQSEVTQPVDSNVQRTKWRKAFEYGSDGLNALYDLIESQYFSNGKPIYDIADLPLKKKLESKWLQGRTLMEADTIITSKKRKGKAKK